MSETATPKVTGLVKFATDAADERANKFGICNNRGELVTSAYLDRYVQCWCRKENGYTLNRKENFVYFRSEAFLSTMVGKTASQVGKVASLDSRWGVIIKKTAAKTPATTGEPAPTVETSTAEVPPTSETVFESTPPAESAGEPAPAAQEPEKKLSKKQRMEMANALAAAATNMPAAQ